jgi:diguanylate cyclase (GGDEF)-like protein/PAS domain S-box-containing protein
MPLPETHPTMDAMADFDGPAGRDVPLRDVIDAFMEQAQDGVVVVDADHRIVMMNEQAEELFGYDHQELLGKPVQVLLPGGLPGPQVEAMGSAKDGRLREAEIDVLGQHKGGGQLPVHLSVSYPEAAGGTVAMAFVRPADGAAGETKAVASAGAAEGEASAGEATLTGASKDDAEASSSSLHDSLTGLPGRVLFTDRLSVALARSDRRTSSVAVILLDLDRFRLANDSYGRETGDRLLVAVAERLFGALRPGDTVARVGEDEFAVLCDDIAKREGAATIAERVHAAVVAPYAFEGEEIAVSATLGYAVASGRDHSPESLYYKAQEALGRAKDHRPGNIEGSDPTKEQSQPLPTEQDAEASTGDEPSGTAESSAGEATPTGASKDDAEAVQRDAPAQAVAVAASPGESLVRALERAEFRLLYQPIIRLRTGQVAGVEALLRWEDPQRGLLSPAEFMADAEATGLIVQIGTWVLREAVRDAERLQAASPTGEPLMLSVNLSAKQLAEPAFAQVLRQILAGSRMDPGTLYLEIGESSVMDDTDAASAVLNDLRSTGVRMSIDDFGTGFSSLLHLNRFPIDFLKVDRSFVNLMDTESGASNIVTAVIAMAHALGLPAIAEGVETEIQLHTLRQLGCDYAQGYLFARPAPVSEVVELLSGDPVW